MKRIQYIFLSLTALVLLSGCASMQDGLVGCETRIRNKCRAQVAWNEWSWCYDDLDHPFHFAKGFKAGYKDILNGGKGCQPTLPPKCYYKSCYRSPEGRCKVNAWFDGFLHGVLAAQQDGAGAWSQIPLSPTARMNMNAIKTPRQPMAAGGVALPPPIADGGPSEIPAPAPPEQLIPDDAIDAGEGAGESNVTLPLPYE
jgi:uncharacterized protein YceK